MKKKLASFAPPAFVAFAFLISRWLYIRAGLHFDNTPPRYYYQFVDPELLKEGLWESLWYLHSQPPLFNFMTGLLYQFFSPQSKIYQLLFLGMGLVFGLSLYWLGLRLGLRPWISALLAAWFMVSPAPGERQLLVEELLVGDQDLEVVREARVVTIPRQVGRVLQRRNTLLALESRLALLGDRDQRAAHEVCQILLSQIQRFSSSFDPISDGEVLDHDESPKQICIVNCMG